MGFQVNGNTFIDNTGSAIFNANTSVANNFSVQLTPFASRESTSPMQGTVAGFTAGGNDGSSPPTETNVVDKFPFANELTAVDHGDLSVARRLVSTGHSSDTDGFVSGGYSAPASPTTLDVIDKYSFATNVTASDHGDLSQARERSAGQSSAVNGYTSGGLINPPPGNVDTIDKFPFASTDGASDVGDLSQTRRQMPGQSSTVSGYTSGGFTTVNTNTIDKFPFATDTNASDVGDLAQSRRNAAGQSSAVSGYSSGGFVSSEVDTIDKFPFATDSNASDVGNLVGTQFNNSGQNSRENGYSTGGYSGSTEIKIIQRFPFATDTNAGDVGNLTQARHTAAGAQD